MGRPTRLGLLQPQCSSFPLSQARSAAAGRAPTSSAGKTCQSMDHELKAMSRRRKDAHAELVARGSTVFRAFLEMEQAAFADGELPKKVKELIAVGISLVINCESCMQWHIEQAALAGAAEREVLRSDRGRHGDGRGPRDGPRALRSRGHGQRVRVRQGARRRRARCSSREREARPCEARAPASRD